MSLTSPKGSFAEEATSSPKTRAGAHFRREPVAGKASLRHDIQGLRTVAVLAVIADHLISWPTGGFVGVDVFFVISGFLITGLLLREWQRTGSISFAGFYRRRIKRILPVSLLVIAVSLLASRLLFAGPRFSSTAVDSLWAALFSANWRFLSQGNDYFQADGPVSPLRHYWSLAVEEQFYFVWPWILLAVLIWCGRRGVSKSAALGIAGGAITVLTLASLLWAMHESSTDPAAAYYSSFSRAWELGVGAVLAFAVPICARIPAALRPVLGNLGLLGILVSVFLISPGGGFPAPGALLPVLSTAVVIAAGSGGPQRFMWLLTNPLSRYLGDISFSLYLWHFPVIVFLGTLIPAKGNYYVAIALAMTLGLSIYSYRLVEDPIRRSSWLAGRRQTGAFRHSGSGTRQDKLRLLRSLAGFAVFLIAASSAVAIRSAATPVTPPTEAAVEHMGVPPAPVAGPAGEALQKELAAAASATSWPEFNPSLEELMSKDPHPDRVLNCGTEGNHTADECTFGPANATKHAVLVGDSISQRWAFPLTKLYAENGWNIRLFGRPGCPFNDYPMVKSPEEGAKCSERKKQAVDFIERTKPDIVFVGNTMVPERMPNGKDATGEDWKVGMQSILKRTSAAGKRVILSPPPFDKDVRECYSPVKGPAACLGTVTKLWYQVSAADAAAAAVTNSVYVDTRSLFCTAKGACPEFAGNIPVKKDHTHFTLPYGYHIQDALTELLAAQGLL